MADRDFSLTKIITDFQLTETYQPLFLDLVPIVPSPWLSEALEMGRRLVLPGGNEKARSEFLIAPILLELERHDRDRLAIDSGNALNVDSDRGLVGECDFLLARGPSGFTGRVGSRCDRPCLRWLKPSGMILMAALGNVWPKWWERKL